MALDILAGLDDVVATIQELEFDGEPLRVTTDLGKANPPCVWVAVDTIDHHNAGGETTVRLFLIGPDTDEYRALKALSPMLEALLTVIPPTEATTVVSVAPTSLGKPLPALRLTTTVTN